MPSSAEHRAKYEDNRALLDSGARGQPLAAANECWAAVVAFYAALHLIDRAAARSNVHPGSHADRTQFVGARHRAIQGPYTALKLAAGVARYGTLNQFARLCPPGTVQTVLIDQHLAAVEAYVAAAFTPPAGPGQAAGS